MSGKLDRIVTVQQHVMFQEVAGESVLLDMESEQYFGLNEVGTEAWKLMLEHPRLADVLAAMEDEYDVSPDVLRRDLLELVDALQSKGLILVEDRSQQDV